MEILSLYELNNLVHAALEVTFTDEYWVQAELSEVRQAYNGHCYVEFIQKDRDGQNLIAKARGTIWNSTYRLLKPYFERETGQEFVAGLNVLVRVSVSFHELYGYSLQVTDIDPTYTLGDLARRRKDILKQLSDDGILNDNKELPLPILPNRVAVISSSTAAGYGDFCNQLLGNEYGFRFHVQLFPAVMQGDRVESSVLDALDMINRERDQWDVVVIIRGGGATSDLTGFDTYLLAASCAQFPLPIITGIGHERDDTVIDCVAHTRVKTPTAAAAFLIDRLLQAASHLETVSQRFTDVIRRHMELESMRLERMSARLPLLFGSVRSQQEQILLARLNRIEQKIGRSIQQQKHDLDTLQQKLRYLFPLLLEQERHRLQLLEQRSQAADPVLLLKRGYSLTFAQKNGSLLKSSQEILPGDTLITRFSDGEIYSVVQSDSE